MASTSTLFVVDPDNAPILIEQQFGDDVLVKVEAVMETVETFVLPASGLVLVECPEEPLYWWALAHNEEAALGALFLKLAVHFAGRVGR